MKKSRFSEEQMVKILREADRTPIAEVAKKHGVSEQTIYVWRRRFGKMDVADTKKLKALEAENARLKKMVAARDLDVEHREEDRLRRTPRVRRGHCRADRARCRSFPAAGQPRQEYRLCGRAVHVMARGRRHRGESAF